MKSQIGREHIRSSSEGRITQNAPGGPQEPSAKGAGDKTQPITDPSELVAVVVHVEKGALNVVMDKSTR